MPDEPIKKRLTRAKKRAHDDLRSIGYEVIISDGRPICLIAYRDNSVRIIRVCLDNATPADLKTLSSLSFSPVVSREVWVRKSGDNHFTIHKL